jgi:hypothetical protein
MKNVLLTAKKRQDLDNWMLENLIGKHYIAIARFLAENETEIDPVTKDGKQIGGGGSAGAPRKPRSGEEIQ